MERLVTVVQELSLTRTLETIMAIVRVAARELTAADGASFVVREQEQCFYADEDAIAPLWKGKRFPMNICIGGWTMQNRQAVIIEDIDKDSRIPYQAYQPTFVKSLAVVPIRTLDPLGAIGVYWARKHQPTTDEVKLLQALADTTAQAMENVQIYCELEQRVQLRTAQLEAANQQLLKEIQSRQQAEAAVRRLSLTDELTGLYNRRGFFTMAQKAMKLARRIETHGCIFFIDLDGLKQINDTLGHVAGDAMIIDAAGVLKQTFRSSDIVARLGGDEFVVFAAGCKGGNGEMLKRLLNNVEQFNATQQRDYQLSISVGIEPYPRENKLSLQQLLVRADQAMYATKKAKSGYPG